MGIRWLSFPHFHMANLVAFWTFLSLSRSPIDELAPVEELLIEVRLDWDSVSLVSGASEAVWGVGLLLSENIP